MSETGGRGLQELLFETLFWQVNLGYFDGFPLDRWPQSDCGIALWSLSVSDHDWAEPKHLSRLATVPIIGVLRAEIWDDLGTPLFEHRILRPLVWFGLLEMRPSETQKSAYSIDHVYRKSRLFDRTIKFTVELEGVRNALH